MVFSILTYPDFSPYIRLTRTRYTRIVSNELTNIFQCTCQVYKRFRRMKMKHDERFQNLFPRLLQSVTRCLQTGPFRVRL